MRADAGVMRHRGHAPVRHGRILSRSRHGPAGGTDRRAAFVGCLGGARTAPAVRAPARDVLCLSASAQRWLRAIRRYDVRREHCPWFAPHPGLGVAGTAYRAGRTVVAGAVGGGRGGGGRRSRLRTRGGDARARGRRVPALPVAGPCGRAVPGRLRELLVQLAEWAGLPSSSCVSRGTRTKRATPSCSRCS